jgi:long-chain alkane monooxygenase
MRAASGLRSPRGGSPVSAGPYFVVGSTEEEAHRKEAEIDNYLSHDGMLAHASGAIGVDLGDIPWTSPIGEIE